MPEKGDNFIKNKNVDGKETENIQSDVDEVEEEENGVLFYVNKSGFPINNFTWNRMLSYASKIHPDGDKILKKVSCAENLPQIPIPKAPLTFSNKINIEQKIQLIQKYMTDLQYNYTGTQFFDIGKYRPISGLMDVAKEMIKESLPIKCLEAVILGIYLTNNINGLERFTIGFKSVFNGSTCRHVVLGVSFMGRYGVIGMSRRSDLMYKPIEFESLTLLIKEFIECYENYSHKVKTIKIGCPLSHDMHSFETIPWKGVTLNLKKLDAEGMTKLIEKHSKVIRLQCRSSDFLQYAYLKKNTIKKGNTMPIINLNRPEMKSTISSDSQCSSKTSNKPIGRKLQYRTSAKGNPLKSTGISSKNKKQTIDCRLNIRV